MRMHSDSKIPRQDVLQEPVPTAPPTPEPNISYVDMNPVLTDDLRALLKQKFGARAKKTTILGNTFVFLCANRLEWEQYVDGWRNRLLAKNENITEEMFDKNLINSFVIFPSVGMPFKIDAEDTVYWNSLPAGVQPKLARLIEHHAGFVIPSMLEEDDFIIEDLFPEDVDIDERPSEEVIQRVKASTDMPCRLIKFMRNWYIIRALRWSEAKNTRKKIIEDPEGNHEIIQLKEIVIYGPTDFDKYPAGVVPVLLAHMRQVSGLPLDDEPVLNEEVENL